MKEKRIFTDRDFYSKLLKLTIPITLQSLMLALVAAADALMLGSVEQNAMSAVSLATQIQFIQNMAITSVVSTLSILGAQYWGKKDLRSLGDVFFISLKVNGLIGALFCAGCVLTPKVLMLIFTNEPELIAIGMRYLRIAGFSYLATGISQCFLTYLKVTDRADVCARISTVTVFLNILLNGILIFGLFGLPALGVQGAAIATLTARIVEMIWSIWAVEKDKIALPDWKQFAHSNRLLAMDYFKCVWPLLGAAMFWSVGFASYTAFMGHLGTDAAAANSVAAVVRDLVCCMCNGVSAAGGIMVGNELGAGKLEKGKLYGNRVMVIGYIIGFASTLIMLALTPVLMALVKLTGGARAHLTGMMVIMAVYMIGRCVNTVIINGIFAAGGDTLFDMYSLAVSMWGIAIPLAAAGTFLFHWPVLVVYACTCLDEVGKIPWVMIHYKKYKWVKDLTRERVED